MEILKPGEVHVWYLWTEHVTDTVQLRKHAGLLSKTEVARAESFRFEQDRNSHVLGQAFVRLMLSRYSSTDPTDWVFTRNEFGKPAISSPAGASDICFNISNTKGLIAGVFALNSAVGIDAEHHQERVDAASIAEEFLSPAEYAELRDMEGPDRYRRFLEYWTLKEAYAKAKGVGLSMDLSGFTFKIQEDTASISFHSNNVDDLGPWNFRLLRPSLDHTVAVAVCCFSKSEVRLDTRDGTFVMR